MTDFSIIIPTYNSSKYIKNLLTNFSNLTYKNIELIIIDDGSTDKSYQICTKCKEKDNRIKTFKKKNGGPSSARNYGIEKANGKYIAFIDSDDNIDFEILYKKFTMALKNKYDMLITVFKVKNIKNLNIEDKNEVLNRLIITEEINSPCSKIYLSKIIKDNNIRFPVDFNLGEDLYFNIQYYINSNNIKLDSEQYYYYIKHYNSLTTKYRSDKLDVLFKLNNTIKDKFDSKNLEIIESLNCIKIKNCYSYIIDLVNNFKIKKVYKDLKVIRKKIELNKVKNIKYKILRMMFLYFPRLFFIIALKITILIRKKLNNHKKYIQNN